MSLNLKLSEKITIFFLFAFFLLISVLYSFHENSNKDLNTKILKRYIQLEQNIRNNRFQKQEVIEYLGSFNFKPIDHPYNILNNRNNKKIKKNGFELILDNNMYYFHVLSPHFRLLFKDQENTIENNYFNIIVYILIIVLFIIVYILILKNIKDSELLLKSRQLFLRTVMHELKTPVAKGKIVSELIDNEKQKKRMQDIFSKLNFLIDDFAKVEEVLSKNYTINSQKYNILEIIDNSFSLLMIDEIKNNISIDIDKGININADIDLISMAIKNLLDNGLKYSKDRKVQIISTNKSISIISYGEKLKKPLEEYFKPFHNDTKSLNHGMGLGLYIVHSIVEMHEMKLDYSYADNTNTFSISF